MAKARNPVLFAATLALLAACGTPQERCIAGVTRDLRVLDRLIGETEGNLARGYGYREVVRTRTRRVLCAPPRPAAPGQPAEPAQYCWDDYEVTERVPAAIDLGAERSKLASMQAKRRDLERAARAPVAQCKAQFPE